MARTVGSMEAHVAAALFEYLATRAPDVEFEEERELEQRLCSTVAALVDQLVQGDDRWPFGWWVDDIDMCAIKRDGSRSVTLSGLAITGTDNQWIEPVRATFALGTSSKELAGYEVFVGDAALGLGTAPFGGRRPKTWPHVQAWVFTFQRTPIGS